jgi:hypothetical protein
VVVSRVGKRAGDAVAQVVKCFKSGNRTIDMRCQQMLMHFGPLVLPFEEEIKQTLTDPKSSPDAKANVDWIMKAMRGLT